MFYFFSGQAKFQHALLTGEFNSLTQDPARASAD